MRIGHVCTSCGFDLSRLRAPLDQHLQLPVVTCPKCRVSSVRRYPTALSSRRTARRIWGVAIHLITRVPVALALVGGTCAICALVRQTQAQTGMTPYEGVLATIGLGDPDLIEAWRGQAGQVVVVATICWGTLVGAIVTGGLVHVRRRWVLWAWLIGAVLVCFGAWSIGEGASQGSHAGHPGPFTVFPVVSETFWRMTTTLMYIAPVLVAGVPLGLMARSGVKAREARRFRRVRLRVRKQRERA